MKTLKMHLFCLLSSHGVITRLPRGFEQNEEIKEAIVFIRCETRGTLINVVIIKFFPSDILKFGMETLAIKLYIHHANMSWKMIMKNFLY